MGRVLSIRSTLRFSLADGGIVIRGFRSQVVDSACAPYTAFGGTQMSLKKEYIRDAEHRIISSVTSGFTGAYDQSSRTSTNGSSVEPARNLARHAMNTAL